jgi:hypothetical protein
MVLFQNNQWSLEMGRLPDLRFQNVNIDTKIHKSVTDFMNSTGFLGLLIGPTGCGKSHEMIRRAKMEFTIFIDAKWHKSSEPNDLSLAFLKQSFESITKTWGQKNQDLPQLQNIAYAFLLSRMLFLKYLKEKYPNITPTQFLIHQMFNSSAINNCFLSLAELSPNQLFKINKNFIKSRCLICVDEAHVLIEHLGDKIISSMIGNHIQQNGDVNENAKRGTLSVLLHAAQAGEFAKKILFAGTSSKLRNTDNFGTFETKPVAPRLLNQFAAWDQEMALNYVSSYVDISKENLKNVLTDNYRPRILENFVYDLFCIGMNDDDSPMETRDLRIEKRIDLLNITEILQESYKAVIHRFTRVSIDLNAETIRRNCQTEILIKLLLSSMMTRNGRPINCQLNENQRNFFIDTIGSVYLVGSNGGYSFFEGYVIDSFLHLFEDKIREYKLLSSLNLLRSIIGQEGKKTAAKGTAFEAVVLADIMNRASPDISQLLSSFGISAHHDLNNLRLPQVERKMDDEYIISERPQNVFMRPSNQFRPDILAFLAEDVCISFGIKIYTSRISLEVHNDNLESTDPYLFFSKSGQSTNKEKRSLWEKSIKDNPIKFSVRFLLELPEPANTVSIENVHHVCDDQETVIIIITRSNMREMLSKDVCSLIEFVTKD